MNIVEKSKIFTRMAKRKEWQEHTSQILDEWEDKCREAGSIVDSQRWWWSWLSKSQSESPNGVALNFLRFKNNVFLKTKRKCVFGIQLVFPEEEFPRSERCNKNLDHCVLNDRVTVLFHLLWCLWICIYPVWFLSSIKGQMLKAKLYLKVIKRKLMVSKWRDSLDWPF